MNIHRLLDQLRKGDVLIVSRLDRLSRSLRELLMIIERIKEAEAGLRSLAEAIDTTTASGRMMMQMVGPFAEFERAILRERTKTGLDAAVSVAASEAVNRMRSWQWYQQAPKLPLTPRDFSMFIQRRYRALWAEPVPEALGEGVMYSHYT
jgi:DNA invertase Pin-like site-specific DNA recombinase